MKHKDLKIFTQGELAYFKHFDLSLEVLDLAKKNQNLDLTIPNDLKLKIENMCKVKYEEYAKIIGIKDEAYKTKKFNLTKVRDIIESLYYFQQLVYNEKTKNIIEPVIEILSGILNSIFNS